MAGTKILRRLLLTAALGAGSLASVAWARPLRPARLAYGTNIASLTIGVSTSGENSAEISARSDALATGEASTQGGNATGTTTAGASLDEDSGTAPPQDAP